MAVAPFRSPGLPAFGLALAAGWGQGPEVVAELEDECGVVWIRTDRHQKGLPISLVQLGAETFLLSALLLKVLPFSGGLSPIGLLQTCLRHPLLRCTISRFLHRLLLRACGAGHGFGGWNRFQGGREDLGAPGCRVLCRLQAGLGPEWDPVPH